MTAPPPSQPTPQQVHRDAALLHRAAQHLTGLADGATYREGRWSVDVAGPLASTTWLGPAHDALTATWRQAAYLNTLNPNLARLLAAWLASAAVDAEQIGPDPHALTLARHILPDD